MKQPTANNINVPLVTIITVVFNGEQHLEQTIQSVINQTHENIEYIIIDGGSTDGTLDLIKRYESHISHWVSEDDDGLYDAMNKGIGLANGELIGMINSDDWYETDTVSTVVNAYLKNPEKRIFHGNSKHISTDGTISIRKFNPSVLKFKYYGTTYEHPTFFVTRDEYKQHVYNTELSSLSDYQFMLEAYLSNKHTYFYIDQALTNFRLGGISSGLSLYKKLTEGFIARKRAGMNILSNFMSLTFRLLIFTVYKVL